MIHVRLSRRNLKALLAKLDGKPAGSLRRISRYVEETGLVLILTAEEDDAHYAGRTPDPMHYETEEAIRETPRQERQESEGASSGVGGLKTRADCACEVKRLRPADIRAGGN